MVAVNLGNLLLDTQRATPAEPLLAEALAGFSSALGASHPNVGIAHLSLGRLHLATASNNALEAAVSHFRSASELLAAGPPPYAPRALSALLGEAEAHKRLGSVVDMQRPLQVAVTLLVERSQSVDQATRCRVYQALQGSIEPSLGLAPGDAEWENWTQEVRSWLDKPELQECAAVVG